MIKILFICHGNICRSPMAEFIFRDLLLTQNLAADFSVRSAATSSEEIGNPVYPPAKAELFRHGIGGPKSRLATELSAKRARQVTKNDYTEYDYLIAMEDFNIKNLMRIMGGDPEHKIFRLLDFTETPGNIDDPWYTGKFEVTYDQIEAGCKALLKKLKHM